MTALASMSAHHVSGTLLVAMMMIAAGVLMWPPLLTAHLDLKALSGFTCTLLAQLNVVALAFGSGRSRCPQPNLL